MLSARVQSRKGLAVRVYSVLSTIPVPGGPCCGYFIEAGLFLPIFWFLPAPSGLPVFSSSPADLRASRGILSSVQSGVCIRAFWPYCMTACTSICGACSGLAGSRHTDQQFHPVLDHRRLSMSQFSLWFPQWQPEVCAPLPANTSTRSRATDWGIATPHVFAFENSNSEGQR